MKSLRAGLGLISRGSNTLWAHLWLFGCTMTLVTAVVGIVALWWAFRPPFLPFAASAGHSWIGGWALHWGILLLALLICAGASAILADLLARRIHRPITAASHAAAGVVAGNRSIRLESTRTVVELEELVGNFNRMLAHIDTYNRERIVFAAGIAHELRTPLTILKGRLHGLEDGVIEPSAGEATRLLRQADHLLLLVNDLATLAHAHAGELSLDVRRVDLCDLLRAVVSDVQPVAGPLGVQIIEIYQPASVKGDPVRLAQIFLNLLSNAVKHAPNNQQVTVSVALSGERAVTSIIDEGPGFNSVDERLLFMPFWRAHSNREANLPGSGLGLALAAKLTEIHGGQIDAANRRDRSGAIFTVSLPLAR
jgi:two-component system sensor histidine kinase AdeS